MAPALRLADLSNFLPTPAYSTNDVAIHHGDCMELLKRLPDGSVPLVVTSPPYFRLGKSFEQPDQTLDEYVDWLIQWMWEVRRVLVPHGSLWLNIGFSRVGGVGTVPISYLLWAKGLPLTFQQECVWWFRAGGGNYRRRLAIRSDRFILLTKHPTDFVFNLDAIRDSDVRFPNQWVRTSNGGRRRRGRADGKKTRSDVWPDIPFDVWDVPKVTSGRGRSDLERQPFEAQMPIALAERAILVSSRPNDVCLDPFSGAASTGCAALTCGRPALLFELNADYVQLATARLARESSKAVAVSRGS